VKWLGLLVSLASVASIPFVYQVEQTKHLQLSQSNHKESSYILNMVMANKGRSTYLLTASSARETFQHIGFMQITMLPYYEVSNINFHCETPTMGTIALHADAASLDPAMKKLRITQATLIQEKQVHGYLQEVAVNLDSGKINIKELHIPSTTTGGAHLLETKWQCL